MHILLTNDDSHISPLFRFAIDILKTLGKVTIVVPNEEQSWTGKSMSRFQPLTPSQLQLQDDVAHGVNGTPADCVNLGVHHLCAEPPDLVVSGINMGVNAGLGFFFASGTIGACLEANIAGIPAVALSQSLERAVFQEWMQYQRMPDGEETRLRQQTEMLLEHVFQTLLGRADFLHHPVTWNVNLPHTAAADWQLVPTVLGHTMYGSCFKPDGETFRHAVELPQPDPRDHADSTVVRQGQVSMTHIDIRQIAQTIVHPQHEG
jgi:5'-nucleotidase